MTRKPIQLVPVRLVAWFALYVASELLMAAALFVHYVPAGFFAIGFFVWIDLFTGKTLDTLRGKTNVSPHAPHG